VSDPIEAIELLLPSEDDFTFQKHLRDGTQSKLTNIQRVMDSGSRIPRIPRGGRMSGRKGEDEEAAKENNRIDPRRLETMTRKHARRLLHVSHLLRLQLFYVFHPLRLLLHQRSDALDSFVLKCFSCREFAFEKFVSFFYVSLRSPPLVRRPFAFQK
jgi:hypothetical protein